MLLPTAIKQRWCWMFSRWNLLGRKIEDGRMQITWDDGCILFYGRAQADGNRADRPSWGSCPLGIASAIEAGSLIWISQRDPPRFSGNWTICRKFPKNPFVFSFGASIPEALGYLIVWGTLRPSSKRKVKSFLRHLDFSAFIHSFWEDVKTNWLLRNPFCLIALLPRHLSFPHQPVCFGRHLPQ